MAKKFKKFEFDFNEDAEPVAELRRLRVAMSKHFKTVDALMEYYREANEERKRIDAAKAEATAQSTAKPAKSAKAKPAAKTPVRPRRKALVKAK